MNISIWKYQIYISSKLLSMWLDMQQLVGPKAYW